MDYRGIVTHVDPTFLFFILDNNINVHMSILLTQNPLQKLPKIGSTIGFKNAHCIGTTYSVCENCTLEGEFTVEYNKGVFFDLVKGSKLGCHDLRTIENILKEFETNYSVLEKKERINLILEVLKYLVDVSEEITLEEHVCLNKHKISCTDFITVNSCRYIEARPDPAEKFNNFPYWSFGIHKKPLKHILLFGFIYVCKVYGFILLIDDCHRVPCIIFNATTDQIASINGTFIFIKEYRVVTEIYQESNVPNIEYLLINFNDIDVVRRQKKDKCLFGKTVPSHKTFKNSLYFQILRKSTICVGNTGNQETWLQILSENDERTVSSEMYLILTSRYIEIAIYLEEGHRYKLLYNETLNEIQNVELTRLKKLNIFQLQEDNAFFLKFDEAVIPKNYLTVEQCKNYVSTHTNLVSFQGILKAKKFGTILPSRTIKRTNLYGFGTPGSRSHQLVFSYEEDRRTVYLDCYLNNWENLEMPLGLIPQMNVIVRNVIPQSKKYLKSSVFTTFEIVAYKPSLDFQTANLYKNVDLDWGYQSYLGLGNKIPYGVLMWGKVCNVQILSLKYSSADFLVKMHVSDEFGQSKVLAKFLGIMKVFLDLQEYEFKIWLDAFKRVGYYEYNMFEEEEVTDTVPECSVFKKTLTEYIKDLNKRSLCFLSLKCRKLDSSPLRNKGRPLWFCVDARR